MQINLKDLTTKMILLTDYLCPTLSSAEQAIIIQFFSRTILFNVESWQVSYYKLAKLTGLHENTVSKAVESLLDKRILILISAPKPRAAAEYRLAIPENYPATMRFQRDPFNIFKGEPNTIQRCKLTPEGREVLEVIKTNLSQKERSDMEQLAMLRKQPGDNLDDLIDDIIVHEYMSDDKKRIYLIQETE